MKAPSAPRRPALSVAITKWFNSQGWRPLAFQEEVWALMAAGRSGLLHATTGAGKTLAVGLGALLALRENETAASTSPPLRVLWITPMRALAAHTAREAGAARFLSGGLRHYSVRRQAD
jgi:ATP-dependent Lhr-like helicase